MQWLQQRAADVVLVVVGAILIGVGLGLSYSERPIDGGVVTMGRIVGHVTTRDSDGSRSSYPVIEFRDQQEQLHQFQNDVGGSGFGVEGKVGQVVKIRYDPSNPERAQWIDQPGRWIPKAAVAAGAVVWLVEVGLAARRLLGRRRQPEPSDSITQPGASSPTTRGPSPGTMLTEPVVLVRQVWRGRALPEYDLFDQHWASLGTARRARPPGTLKRLGRALISGIFPGPFHVVDPTGTLLFEILLASERGQVILVRDRDGNLLGKGIRTKSGLKPHFDLEVGGQFVGTMGIEDWKQRVGTVHDAEGRDVAELRTITTDDPYHVSSDSQGYYLKINQPLTDSFRRVVLACAIVLQAAITSESQHSTFDITWSLPKRSRAKTRR